MWAWEPLRSPISLLKPLGCGGSGGALRAAPTAALGQEEDGQGQAVQVEVIADGNQDIQRQQDQRPNKAEKQQGDAEGGQEEGPENQEEQKPIR